MILFEPLSDPPNQYGEAQNYPDEYSLENQRICETNSVVWRQKLDSIEHNHTENTGIYPQVPD